MQIMPQNAPANAMPLRVLTAHAGSGKSDGWPPAVTSTSCDVVMIETATDATCKLNLEGPNAREIRPVAR